MEKRGDEVHVNMEEARAGSSPGVVRYVLIISLVLVIVALTAIWMTGALTDDNPQGGGIEGNPSTADDASTY